MEDFHEIKVTYHLPDEQYTRLLNLLERWNKLELLENHPLSTEESLFDFMMRFESSYDVDERIARFERVAAHKEEQLNIQLETEQTTPAPQIFSQTMYDSMNPTQRYILKSVLETFAQEAPIRISIQSPTALRVSDSTGDVIMFSNSPGAPVYDDYNFPHTWEEHQAAHQAPSPAPEPVAF